jgi:hypothetical protein
MARELGFEGPSWSPFSSIDHALYQVKLIGKNSIMVARHLAGMSTGLGLVALVGALMIPGGPGRLAVERWRWGVIPVVSIASIYVLVYCGDARYFWVCFPFLFSMAWGLVDWLRRARRSNRLGTLATAVVCAAFTFGQLRQVIRAHNNEVTASGVHDHLDLAQRLKQAGLNGPVAGSSARSFRCSLYVAFFLEQPWFGDVRPGTIDLLKTSKARIIVVDRREPVAADLEKDRSFRDLDEVLFSSAVAADQCGLKAFEFIPGEPNRSE